MVFGLRKIVLCSPSFNLKSREICAWFGRVAVGAQPRSFHLQQILS